MVAEPAGVEGLFQGFLDAAGLARMADDLEAHADVLHMRARRRVNARDQPPLPSVRHALRAVADGDVAALQLRYVYDGQTWLDTLLARDGGARVVRTLEPRPPQ